MDLTRLRAFYTVAQTGSFTRAATRLHLTQPSISRQVKSLEKTLGVKLLERHPRRITITPEGDILLRHVEQLFDDVAAIESLFQDISKLRKTQLQLACNESTALHVLPPSLERFSRQHPYVELAIHTMRTAEIVASVRDASVDLGLTLGKPKREELTAIPIAPYEMVFITPAEHPLARKKRIALEDIADFPLISYTRNTETRTIIDRPFREKKLNLDIKMELGNTDLILKYVELGYGVALVHNLGLTSRSSRSLSVHSLRSYFDPEWVYLIYSKNHRLSRAAEAFLGMVREGS